MAGNTAIKLYGPLAAVGAAVATALASAEIPPLHLHPAPYLLYAAHPSMPVPPLSSNPLPQSIPKPSSQPKINAERIVVNFASDSLRTASVLRFQQAFLPSANLLYFPNLLSSSDSSVYQRSNFACQAASRQSACSSYPSVFSPSFAASDYIRSWQSKDSAAAAATAAAETKRKFDSSKNINDKKREVTVVLLGWLGAKQKHLKKYADWYTERGINAVTFVIPMSDMISFKAGGKAEQQIDQLAHHLLAWMNEEEDGKEKHLFFHTFSNTGWLTYGVLLERLLRKDDKLLDKVKGCVVDSAPVAESDPQVWASGFSAAFLKKKSVASRKVEISDILKDSGEEVIETQLQADVREQALVSMLEKFFSVFLQLPYVKKRLSEVVTILSQQQPKCPQLYFYSSADKVIPAKSVESFMEEQRRAGRTVKACNLLWSPHVDHFRSFPDIYGSQLNNFIHECLSQFAT